MKFSGASRHVRGFTLVECIICIVILAIAVAGIAAMQGNIFTGQSSVTDLQVRTRIMEECAEQVLAVRQRTAAALNTSGYDAVNTPTFNVSPSACGGLQTLTSGGTTYSIPTVSISAEYNSSPCPSVGTCKNVVISQAGMTALTIMLVDY